MGTSGKHTPDYQIERVVYLRDVQKLDFRVIAQRLGLSPDSPSRIYRRYVQSRHLDSNRSSTAPGASAPMGPE